MDYSPGPVPQDSAEIPRYLAEEFQRLASILITAPSRQLEFLNVAPAKPRDGMIAGADGTNWNPGAGKGIYCYYSGSWNKL